MIFSAGETFTYIYITLLTTTLLSSDKSYRYKSWYKGQLHLIILLILIFISMTHINDGYFVCLVNQNYF